MKKGLVFLAVLALVALGCSTQQKQAETAPKKEVTAAQAAAETKATEATETAQEVKEKAQEVTETVVSEECELKEFPNIHFDFDKYDLKPEAKQILMEIAEYMKKCPDIILTIEGHCDERGSNEYNLALGWKRANEAKKFLVALGIDPNRIITVSYGEERPLCFEHNEECWAKNRRDHFVFCKGQCLR
ncbi:peptidoglycan-associated lipoprotein [Thermosulfidibacter takaii ABI70S6]|uniref:Peptidoglycan-associated lipoprotein n=1 Tax=Thermosulfidibacter takaii (strain DSM 17441 / JCM 13301 / NBRC 103674 / ABI70S6) TaxID=1298851 RepID=A0A0S3QVX0_THET7|nr:peptidoglycan-associated lipoprotein Pal [Thermosulfidibacter takaii]BAT72469.1 peptidoglycan-associated lipoprotein [Thermosulfidibacter takaii ABI70S6]